MDAFTLARTEAGIDGAAAAAMAGATGYAAAALLDSDYGPSFAPVLVVTVIIFVMVRLGLGKIPGASSARRPKPKYFPTLSDYFVLGAPVAPPIGSSDQKPPVEDLLLDDELGKLPSGSRVVQLFGLEPSSGAGGSLSGGSHVTRPASLAGEPDTMVEALNQLRRSLR